VELPADDAAWKVAPALAAGNTGGDEAVGADAADRAALGPHPGEIFPKGVVNIVAGRGESVGAGLTGHPQVRIGVAGPATSPTGQKVLQAAAQDPEPHPSRARGKAPVLVFDDADLEGWWRACARRLLQCRAGLHRRLAGSMPGEDLRPAGRRPG